MLDHRSLKSGQRTSILKAIANMASTFQDLESSLLLCTLQKIMTLANKTQTEMHEAKHAIAALLETPAEWTHVFVSLLNGDPTDNYDLLYDVLVLFVRGLPDGNETSLPQLLVALSTATTAVDPAVRHGAALGILAIFDGCEADHERIRYVLQLQPEVFSDVVSGCLDDDVGVRVLYIQCLKRLATALEMKTVLKDLKQFEHVPTDQVKSGEEKGGATGVGAEGDHSTLILIASTHAMEDIVRDAISEYGAVLPQQQLIHLINASEMQHLEPNERLLRMRRVSVWIPTMQRIDTVLLQQLLSTLEDPHPGVFDASLKMFASQIGRAHV
jgi:hypothetical protein